MKKGNICLIDGPMYSGKSSELQRQVRRHVLAKKNCLCITHQSDKRYSTDSVISTHDNIHYPAIRVEKLSQIPEEQLERVDVIAIEEGQFFSDLSTFAEKWVSHKMIIIAGLSSDFRRLPFENMINIYAIANSIIRLTAICVKCGNDAIFSKRITVETDLFITGGHESYVAVCRDCF
jgi:thymidine kinase